MEMNSTGKAMRTAIRNWKRPILTLAAAIGLAICSTSAIAQTQSGLSTIQGTVTDSTGAVIRGASIHIVNKATGATSNAKSNEVGFYLAPGLIAGTYSISVTAPNMKTNVYMIELLATQTAVVNPVMSAGAVTEQVTVSASIVQLTDTTSGAITATLNPDQISHIPMNSRNIASQMLMTTPGLEYGFGGSAGQGTNPGTRMNGLVGEALEFDEDGAPTENRNFGGPNADGQAQYQDPDSVQEVRVEASGSGAQYATPGTAVITTKSGTNQLHGSAFWTGRNNSAAGIAKARNNAYNFAVPNYKRNEFGASAGGPVVIPWLYHGKDKTFWFFAFERYSYIYSTSEILPTETAGMPGGDFSGLTQTLLYDPSTTTANAACPTPGVVAGVTKWNTGTPVNNPYCRTPFGNGIEGDPGNNQIPVTRRNALAKLVYDMQRPPNIAGVTNPLLQANENWLAPNLYFIPTVTFRIDHNFNDKNKAYLHYTSNLQTDQYYGGALGTLAAGGIPALALGSETIAPYTNFVGAAGYTHIFSPSFFSETIISGNWAAQPVSATGNPKQDYESMLNLPNTFGETGLPNISGSVQAHNGNQFDYGINDNIWTGDENLTKTIGKHQMQFGGRYRHEFLHYQPDQTLESEAATALSTGLEQPSTGTAYGAYSGTGHSAADFFLGSFNSMAVNILERDIPFADQETDAYFQDNWHMSRALTLNLGLRWEDHPAQSSGGVGAGIDLVHHAMVLENTTAYYIAHGYTTQSIITAYQNAGAIFETPAQAGFPSRLMRNYPLNFDPRFGFAYQLFGGKTGTVLRGSYGRYSFPEAVRNLLGLARTSPFIQGFSYNNNSTANSPDGIANYEIRNPQNIFLGVNTPSSIVPTTGTNFVNPGTFGGGFNPDFPPTFVQEVNLTVEQSFKDQSALRVTYNYTHANNLTHEFLPNAPLTAFTWEYDTGTTPPTGGTTAGCQYSATALGPWDCKVFGNFGYNERNGWSTDNSLQASYQRLFHRGFGYQINYVWSRAFRIGGNSTRESLDYPIQDYMGVLGTAAGVTYAPAAGESAITMPAVPPPLPQGAVSWADYKALNRFQNYKVDPYYATPFHHITINGIYDLPVGQGKWLLGHANRFVNEIVGGWQIAGIGQVESQSFAPASSNWGPTSPIVTYKHSVPIQDCSAGAGTSKCFNRFMWFNGYISPKLLPVGNGGTCVPGVSNPGCVTGLPTSYIPYETPINNNPNIATNFGNNNVNIMGPNIAGAGGVLGAPLSVAFAPDSSQGYAGNNRFSRSIVHGPFNYETDLSVHKVFPIREKMDFQVNVDAFNALNIQGYINPNSTSGEESVIPGGIDNTTSFWAPRQLQLTMRFSW